VRSASKSRWAYFAVPAWQRRHLVNRHWPPGKATQAGIAARLACALLLAARCKHGGTLLMAGRSDELAAGEAGPGRGHLRASNTDREQVIEVLKTAFVQGRLAKDELDLRVGQALASLTYADLTEITADIPAGLTPPRPAAVPARAPRRPVPTEVQTGLRVSSTAIVLAAALWAAAILTGSVAVFLLACGATGTVFVASFLTGTRMLGAWLDQRPGRPPPPPLPAPPAPNQPSQPSSIPRAGRAATHRHDRCSVQSGRPRAVAPIRRAPTPA
jgi:hypothetical protein